MDVDIERTQGPPASLWLRADARGCDGRVRQERAAAIVTQIRWKKGLGSFVELPKFFKVYVEIEIQLNWLVRAAALVVAVYVILQLPALTENLVAATGSGDLHERSRRVPIIPLHHQLPVFADRGRVVFADTSALLVLDVL